jgi:hypothetical protein
VDAEGAGEQDNRDIAEADADRRGRLFDVTGHQPGDCPLATGHGGTTAGRTSPPIGSHMEVDWSTRQMMPVGLLRLISAVYGTLCSWRTRRESVLGGASEHAAVPDPTMRADASTPPTAS